WHAQRGKIVFAEADRSRPQAAPHDGGSESRGSHGNPRRRSQEAQDQRGAADETGKRLLSFGLPAYAGEPGRLFQSGPLARARGFHSPGNSGLLRTASRSPLANRPRLRSPLRPLSTSARNRPLF